MKRYFTIIMLICAMALHIHAQEDSVAIALKEAEQKAKLADKNLLTTDTKSYNEISESTWPLFPEQLRGAYDTILSNSTTLLNIAGADNIFNGIQTSANKVYVFQPKADKNGVYTFEKDGQEWKVEKNVTRPYLPVFAL